MNFMHQLRKLLRGIGILGVSLLVVTTIGLPLNELLELSLRAATHRPHRFSTGVAQMEELPLRAAYSRHPLMFEVNQGQTDSQVKFLSRGNGYTFFLTANEAVLALA